MRLMVDFRSHAAGAPLITQVERVPAVGSSTPINGKYVLPIVPGAEFSVTKDSYVLNQAGDTDGSDVVSQSFAYLLAMHPQFGHIYFNPLLTAANVAELDSAGTMNEGYPPVTHRTRMQTGREGGIPGMDPGIYPTHTALLAQNATGATPHPGLLVTNEIDIGPYTLDANQHPVGTDEFLLYWKIFGFNVSDDIASDFGDVTGGVNQPAVRSVMEVTQEPNGFSAYISPDNGVHWCPAGLLEPIAFCDKTTKIRVAFKNTSTNKVYLAQYAVIF